MEPGKKTPLWASHKELKARLIDFGGWDMPVSYPAGTIKEHKAVRTAVGLFDVSHMGEAYLRGPRAKEVVARLTTNNCESAPVGKAVYTLLCKPDGGIVDDCIFYKRADDDFMVIFNAGNLDKDLAWFREHASTTCDVIDVSDQTALIAVQGPKAVGMLDTLSGGTLAQVPTFGFVPEATVAGIKVMAARTGYTGEDGFELACANADAPRLWSALLEAATPLGGLPIGLGARDSLRLEAKLPLYGNDLDEDHSPLEAGLGWAVKLEKNFIGVDALRRQKVDGLPQVLVGFKIDDDQRAIARHGYPVVKRGTPDATIGTVTSGGPGLFVGGAIGLAYVPAPFSQANTKLTIDCRGKDATATVVSGKFYKRAT